jgi:Fic family protein
MQPEAFQNSSAGRLVRQPTGYWAFVPNPLPPAIDWSPALVGALSDADRAVGELAGLGRSLPNPDLLIKPFVRREAVLSSRIEGTRASVSDLYTYEAVQLALFELPDDVREVKNYVRALNYGLARLEAFPLSLRFIRELHRELMQGVRGEQRTPGEFRRSQNWIGGPRSTLSDAEFVPPPPAEMREALHDLEQFIHAESDLPPLVRIALIHYQFEAIHPFLDGNGRVGRLLINLLLYAWDLLPHPLLYISAYFSAQRAAYYDGLMAVSRQGAWEAWLLFFLEGVRAQSLDSVNLILRLQALQERYRALFQKERASARLLQVVDALFEQPVFTVPQLAERLDITYPTALRYVNRLADKEVVREVTGRARDRVFSAAAIVEAVSEP